jgi:hypothetical protein
VQPHRARTVFVQSRAGKRLVERCGQ